MSARASLSNASLRMMMMQQQKEGIDIGSNFDIYGAYLSKLYMEVNYLFIPSNLYKALNRSRTNVLNSVPAPVHPGKYLVYRITSVNKSSGHSALSTPFPRLPILYPGFTKPCGNLRMGFTV